MVLIFALDIPRVKTFIARQVATQLEQVLGTKVEINSIEVALLNAVELHDVVLYDRNSELLMSSEMIHAKLRLMPLLQGKVFLSNIAILDANIALYKNEADGEANYQFLVDTFRSKNKKDHTINLTINSLLLRRCNISYNERYTAPATANVFSPHHLRLHDVEANVSLKELTNDFISLRVRHLQCMEQSGLNLTDMRLRLNMNTKEATIQDLYVTMPHSKLILPSLHARYTRHTHEGLLPTLILDTCYPQATISTQDIVPLLPQLKSIDETINISGSVSNRDCRLVVNELDISNGDMTLTSKLKAALDYANSKHTRLGIVINGLKVTPEFVSRLTKESASHQIATLFERIGDLDYKGNFNAVAQWPLSQSLSTINFTSQGTLTTKHGMVSTDFSLKDMLLSGSVNSTNLSLAEMLQNENFPTALNFTLDVKSKLSQPDGEILQNISTRESNIDLLIKKLHFKGNAYSNLHLNADLNGSQATLLATADDASLNLQGNVIALMPQQSLFLKDLKRMPMLTDITAHIDVARLSPSRLNLSKRYKQGVFKFHADAYTETLDLDHLNADLSINDFSISHDGENILPYTVQHTHLSARSLGEDHQLTLRSDFADLDYVGPLHPQRAQAIVQNLLASIRNGQYNDSVSFQRKTNVGDRNNARMSLYFKDSEILHRLLGINISQHGVIHMQGSLAYDGTNMTFSCLAPDLSFGNFRLNDLTFYARNKEGSFNLLAKGAKRLKNGELLAELTAINSGGAILSTIEWDEVNLHKFYGAISASTTFDDSTHTTDEGRTPLRITTDFTPSQLCIGDSLWQFARSRIDYADSRLVIEDFGIYNSKQRLTINGAYYRSREDTIVVSLSNIDLEYALAFAHLGVVDFGGHATGQIFVRQLADGSPWAKANVQVPDFTFNQTPFGIADVNLGWNHEKRDITIQGDIRQPGIGYTRVRGYVDPINRDLDLRTESKNTPLGFLNKYTEGIFSDITGQTTGNCRIYGGFQTIEFSGHELGNCEATIPVTGVRYRVENADVNVVPDAFVINSATVRDMFNGVGTGYGRLTHKYIKDMCYDFSLEGRNLRLYDKPREIDMPFFATANGSGKVHIYGEPHKMNADIRITTIPGSELTYILDSPDADVSQLLTLRNPTEKNIHNYSQPDINKLSTSLAATSASESATSASSDDVPSTDINLYFEVNVDDQSCLHMITDDKSGDVITVYGSGPIQASYHNKSGFQMYGTYKIDRGTYGLNIPSLAQRRKFDILSGGQVSFSGDPTEAEVNVRAQYVVNSASLADLNIGTGFANNTTRVNCVVNIYGEVANMQFNLDFELPNCSDDEQRMVQNLIASEEDRTMQVLYLLGVGRFYAYNYTNNDLGQSQSMLMMNSLLSSTLSSQINNIISDAIGSNNWTFGTNISTGQLGWNDMEVEGLVSSRLLNNRLILNGNFGYSDRVAATTNFVGDFDMQYLITPKGNVLVRAYSETNDRYFTKSMLTTQGIGLQLKHDFTKFINLIRRKKSHQAQQHN